MVVLAKAAGANLQSRLPPGDLPFGCGTSVPGSDPEQPSLVVLVDAVAEGVAVGGAIAVSARAAGLPVLSYKWLMDSVGCYTLQPSEMYAR